MQTLFFAYCLKNKLLTQNFFNQILICTFSVLNILKNIVLKYRVLGDLASVEEFYDKMQKYIKFNILKKIMRRLIKNTKFVKNVYKVL